MTTALAMSMSSNLTVRDIEALRCNAGIPFRLEVCVRDRIPQAPRAARIVAAEQAAIVKLPRSFRPAAATVEVPEYLLPAQVQTRCQ
jgi:hypothetical protein